MSRQRHWLIMAVWVLALMAVAAVYWDRLFPIPGGKSDGAGGAATAVTEASAPAQAGPGGSASLALHQAIKAANPAYNGRGQFAEKNGQITIVVLAGAGVSDLSPLRGLSLEALDVSSNEVSNLSPLRGMPLRRLGLEQTKVADLGPLQGMRLTELYLNNTPVSDISALRGLPLEVLNLYGTAVEDISPLSGMPLQSLWLNGTRVKDISPLRGCSLVSLTLEGTSVADLSPLSGSKLERLHIANSAVTDLTPVAGLPLTRLIFTPDRILRGSDVARNMPTIREIGTRLEAAIPPQAFWSAYDQGKLSGVR